MARTLLTYTCTSCGDDFDLDDDESVSEDAGGILCDACYCTEHHFTCCWCEACGARDDRDRYLVVFAPAHVDVELPGLYRVEETPYYWSAMLYGGILPRAVTWLGFLPALVADPAGFPCGHLCADCQRQALAEVAQATACGALATRA